MRVMTSFARPGDLCKCRLRSRLGSGGRLTQQLYCAGLRILRELDRVDGTLLREEYFDLFKERLQLLAAVGHGFLVAAVEGLLHFANRAIDLFHDLAERTILCYQGQNSR